MSEKQIKAWKVFGKNDLRLVDHDIPATVPAAHLRVKPLFVGTCGSDTDLIARGGAHSAHAGEVKPIIPGHELCGEIVEIGAGVADFKVGDKVVVEPALPCGECVDCHDEAYNCCKHTGYWATPPVDGCFAEFIDVLPEWTYKVPSTLDPMVASLAEPLGACVEAIFGGSQCHPQVETDKWMLIAGGGNIAMGIGFVMNSLFNTNKVILAARQQRDLDFAAKLGVKHIVKLGDKEQNKAAMEQVRQISGGGVKTVIECTGANNVLQDVIDNRVLRGYGRIIGVGCHATVDINVALLRRSSAQFITVRRSLRKFRKTLEMLRDNQELGRQLIGRVGDFEQLPDVLAKKAGEETGTGGPKTVIRFK